MNKKKILLIRSQDILTDSRVHRYEKWFIENNVQYGILGWDRVNKNLSRKSTDYCRINAAYNLGSKGIKYRIKWNIFILKYLISNRKNYDVIHACDFDTIMPSVLMKLFGKYVIFDIFDWFSDEVKTNKKIIDFIINSLEKISVKLSDLTIICEEERLKQIKVKPKNYIIIPNIPSISLKDNEGKKYKEKKYITIGYIGGFYPDRGLDELLDVVSEIENIKLYIAGFGKESIVDKVRKFSETYKNINYFGKVDYSRAIDIMNECDLLYAMYYKFNKNNIYAAPNKFYESIFLQKPIITTKGTLVGNKVLKHKLGYVIDEGEKSLKEILYKLDKEDLDIFKTRLSKLNKEYKNKYKEYMYKYEKHITGSN